MLEMLMSREQLMEDIIAIVDGELSGIISDRLSDELTTRLCDAVCENFPVKWYSGQLPVENFFSTTNLPPLGTNSSTVHYRLISASDAVLYTHEQIKQPLRSKPRWDGLRSSRLWDGRRCWSW